MYFLLCIANNFASVICLGLRKYYEIFFNLELFTVIIDISTWGMGKVRTCFGRSPGAANIEKRKFTIEYRILKTLD